MCLCLGKCLLPCMNMLLHLMCIDPPATSHHPCLFVCLFVCLFISCRHIYYCYFYSRQTSAGEHATSISCPADNITSIECEYAFSGELVNVNANTNQQTKTKEHNMDPSLGPEPLHSLCLPSPLAGAAIRSYNGCISFLSQEPSEAF